MNKREKEILQSQLDNEKKVLKELEQVYKQALKDCEKKIAELSSRRDMENLQSIIYQKQYQTALKGQLEGVLEQLHSNEYATVSDYLTRCYEDGYIGVMYDLQGQGIPIVTPIDQEQVTKAIQTDSKLSKTLYDSLGEDVNKLKRSVRAEVSRGIANGSTWNQIAGKIALSFKNTPFNKAYNRAMTIARTEGHRISIQSADHAQHKAKEKGADIVKQWDATLDGNTRPHHRELDGQIREIDEPFEVGGTEVMYPGGFNDPAEDCNCRCALLQRAKWALDDDELSTLKERAEYFGLDKTKDFEEYKEKYLKASDNVLERANINNFVPAKNIQEAEEFIKQYVDDNGFGALGISYKGINVEVANEINKTISTFFETFNVDKFGGIVAPAGNTKLGKMIDGATAAYSPIRNSFLVNRESMKNMKTAVKSFEAEKDALKNILEHPENYDLSKLSKRVLNVVERAKVSGRTTVPENIEESLNHELGHMLEKKVYKSEMWEKALSNMPDYADKISGYAGENKAEYVAESFASYMKGEKVADPTMIKIFESLKR